MRMSLLKPNNLRVQKAKSLENIKLEDTVYSWVMKQRDAELAVPTIEIAEEATSLDASFHSVNHTELIRWAYEFMKRRRLSFRMTIRKSLITNATMQSVERNLFRRLTTSYNGFIRTPRFLANMDETVVYLRRSPNCTVHPTGEETISIMVGAWLSKLQLIKHSCLRSLFLRVRQEVESKNLFQKSYPRM